MARIAGVDVSLDHCIGGERVPSSDRFDDVSPIDERVLGEVAHAGVPEARQAVDAAERAFEKWASTSPEERAAALHRIANGIEARLETLAAVETGDNGALLRSHLRGIMPRVAHNFRFFADWECQLRHEDFETRGHRNHVSWDPAGVSVLITPWNAPLMLETWKVAPALAAGDTAVLKPAEWSPLTASLLADVSAEAGLALGVFDVVQGIGEEVGDAPVSNPLVAGISFTGSAPTARLIAPRAAANLVPTSFQLGSKSPLLVFRDADMQLAVDLAGLYYRPTLLTGARQGVEILAEEVFGPVLTLQSFESEEEAISLANSTKYGLTATVVTSDEERAARVASHLVAGTVWVNCFFVRDLRAPFGGSRQSGIGREGGNWRFDFYCDVKNSVFAPGGYRS